MITGTINPSFPITEGTIIVLSGIYVVLCLITALYNVSRNYNDFANDMGWGLLLHVVAFCVLAITSNGLGFDALKARLIRNFIFLLIGVFYGFFMRPRTKRYYVFMPAWVLAGFCAGISVQLLSELYVP